jgi:hypothetical protein
MNIGASSFNFNSPPSPANPNPIDLTPSTSYSCQFIVSGQRLGELSWDNTAKILTIDGLIYIDGTATASQAAKYEGRALLMLTGGFYLDANGQKLCAVLDGSGNCDLTTGSWDPNVSVLIIYALGSSTKYPTDTTLTGHPAIGIDLTHVVQFQGALLANNEILADTNAVVEGPMDSKNSYVNAGESGILTYPPIHFLPSGLLNSNTPGRLLTPRNISGG